MNGLKPKINRSGANKPKNNLGSPIVIKTFTQNITDVDCALVKQFINSSCADEQLGILKNIINGLKNSMESKDINFLAIVYYEAPAKHPVKCYLMRHITKCSEIQQGFIKLLSEHISLQLRLGVQTENYAEMVPKLVTCIENFPAGAAAVKCIRVDLTKYLLNCLNYCFVNLRLPKQSATNKNEIFIVEHSALRLLVHIVQKLNSDPEYKLSDWYETFQSITNCIVLLVSDEEVPMDTKCLSGILFVSVETYMNTEREAWMQLLMATDDEYPILKNKPGQLAVFSAIATAIPLDKLLRPVTSDNTPAILDLLHKLLNIVEGSASAPALTLGAARSLLAVSRALGAARGKGARLPAPLLAFVWPHLEHHLDSVRHLAQELLANVIGYCAELERGFDGVPGDPAPLEELLVSVRALGPCRSFYWAVAHAAAPLGAARVLRDLCAARDVLRAAAAPHLQAAAHAAMEALLTGGDARGVFDTWLRPALVAAAHAAALPALEALLPRAVRLHPDVVPYICEYITSQGCPVRVTLACCRAAAPCRVRLACGTLRAAAVDADEEIRVLALSLVAEAARPTAPLSRAELSFALTFLRYNINAPSHNFRQLMLALYKKLLKRLEDGYKAMQRPDSPEAGEHYLEFVERLQELCYSSALRGANYGRRSVALQLLAAVSRMQLAEHRRVWKEEHVETLLQHLDDSYECNKASALAVLECCPVELLQKRYSTSLELRDIQRQAAALRPASAVSAAYMLQLLASRLPARLYPGDGSASCTKPLTIGEYSAVSQMTAQVKRELAACLRGGVAAAARRGAMFGALHCIAATLHRRDIGVHCWEAMGGVLALELVPLCMAVQHAVTPVVAAASPEGHLPAQGRHAAGSEITLDDGRPVTAQMVLICAWRSVKEASAVLGALLAALPATRVDVAVQCGRHYTELLGAAQHRGAVEQACVGFAALARRCWSCPELEHLPRAWLAEQLLVVSSGAAPPATRRGAGLPFMIQTLVSAELEATGRGAGLHDAVSALLRLAADAAAAAPRRTLAANILRALFRHAALAGATHAHVGAALRVAVRGFDASTWPERTAMSLLFAALLVRVFGVSRARRGTDARNTMTGRVFFQRYPLLYDVMLSKLGSTGAAGDGALRPAAYPALLLLARLYPSALEGAASNLKLSAFVPCVLWCARSPVLQTRRLAARAVRALVAPVQYIPHIEHMCALLADGGIPRNYCHGILLQLAHLLEAPPALPAAPGALAGVGGALWILRQAAGERPCYVIAHEYVKVVNLLVWRLPDLVEDDLVSTILPCLEELLFSTLPPPVTAGRDVCLADCLYLYLVLLHKRKNTYQIVQLTLKSLRQTSYEVVLAILNYLLILHNNLDIENDDETCQFREHLSLIRDTRVLDQLKESETYMQMLCNGLHEGKHPECRRKCLTLLTLERDTQKFIINDPNIEDEDLILKLIDYVENEHENVTHVYLESLLDFASGKIGDASFDKRLILFVMRTVFAQSSAVNSDSTRTVVVSYLETNLDKLLKMNLKNLQFPERFEFKATVLSTLVTLLEDDDDVIRQRAADVTAKLCRDYSTGEVIADVNLGDVIPSNVTLSDVIHSKVTLDDVTPTGSMLPSLCGELLRDYIEGLEDSTALFVLLALLDFKSEVVMTDELNDECRVFDQSERYNLFSEESVWTAACADKLIKHYRHKELNLLHFVLSTVHDTQYSSAFERLCKDNLVLLETKASGETINPKVQLFIEKLCCVQTT